jgi:hypothetical protein
MNFRVDLILPSEQRSGSVLSIKSILRIVSIAVPSIILVLFALGIMSMLRLKNEYNLYKGEKDATEPREKTAVKVRGELGQNRGTLNEITGWSASHIDWHKQFQGLQLAVPEQIQFTGLKIDQSLPVDSVPARVFSCTADGKTRGSTPQSDVQLLISQMKSQPLMAALLSQDSVRIVPGSFGDDPDKNAPSHARVFTIAWEYTPLKFKKKEDPENKP